MTWWRRSNYQVNGHADVPDDVWLEFQRMRDAFMRIDQNNVLADGVDRVTILPANSALHGGISRITDSSDAFAIAEDSASPVTITKAASDGVWGVDSLATLTLNSRWDAVWVFGMSAQFSTVLAQDSVECDIGIQAPQSGLTGAVVSGVIDKTQNYCTCGGVTTAFLPAGTHTVNLLYRARWTTIATDVTYDERSLFGFALYR